MRPIVSTIGASYKLAKELAHIVTPLVEHTAYMVRNSTVFVERIHGLQTTPQDTLVSFNVKNTGCSHGSPHRGKGQVVWVKNRPPE